MKSKKTYLESQNIFSLLRSGYVAKYHRYKRNGRIEFEDNARSVILFFEHDRQLRDKVDRRQRVRIIFKPGSTYDVIHVVSAYKERCLGTIYRDHPDGLHTVVVL